MTLEQVKPGLPFTLNNKKTSRLGCIESKRRRIKCHEQRPVCSQCTISERTSSSTGETTESTSTVADANPPGEPAANMLHTDRLYQFMHSTIHLSSMLGLHILCKTLISRDGDFNGFLDSFVPCLRLHQDVRVIIGRSWSMLLQTSNLGQTLDSAERQLQSDGSLGPGCTHLLAPIQQSNLGPSITETYRQTIEALHVPSEYIDLLALRSPDALTVMADYGSVIDYLGPAWSEWLEFPSHVLSAGSHGK
ncbi:Zn(II)2Cys6 transcription factor domain-containing protein [Aspergillus neoniger CBS 115656]|uniref:Zn(2)-C6 fungal-type domain-containing protein n=1 Tax=Aspergillus neoniger (strain CBS 115656) TaxID=1448310 RepID=A0A318Y815_ASPNB|nr:hypothetical protein BO87DRAFT_400722 [Aspergillus neoniger CBS 115656]PYH30044.1 hypothetical protein BO87DRAFT_400722 [Aspergillus neoniger CBS 115656]